MKRKQFIVIFINVVVVVVVVPVATAAVVAVVAGQNLVIVNLRIQYLLKALNFLSRLALMV